jgi:hypothetical protein
MTVLFASESFFGVEVEKPFFTGPFPLSIQAPSGTGHREPLIGSRCPLQRLLQYPEIQVVTAISPSVVYVDHDHFPGEMGKARQTKLVEAVVRLLEAA